MKPFFSDRNMESDIVFGSAFGKQSAKLIRRFYWYKVLPFAKGFNDPT